MIGFVFPGQGSQFVGMGKDLYDHYPEVKKIYAKANEILGINIRDLSFYGPMDVLTDSKNAQPAILIHSYACSKLINEKADIVAGHSLGEYSALVYAEALDFESAIKLVRLRGELMSDVNPGTMAAIIGLETQKVEEVIQELKSAGIITVANYNSPSQVVISGEIDMIDKAIELLKKLGAKSIKLKVSGAFHSPLMSEASKKFTSRIMSTKINKPKIPIVPNVTGKITTSADEIKDCLSKQILSPVRWVDSINSMINYGVTQFIEVGPGKVLSGLISQINTNIKITKFP